MSDEQVIYNVYASFSVGLGYVDSQIKNKIQWACHNQGVCEKINWKNERLFIATLAVDRILSTREEIALENSFSESLALRFKSSDLVIEIEKG